MFALFGLDTQELVILGLMGLTLLIGAVAAVVLVSRVAAGTRERAEPDEAIPDLRDEPDRETGRPA